MHFASFISCKKSGKPFNKNDISAFVKGIVLGDVSDAQIAAFTTSVFINGLNDQETSALSMAMAKEGIAYKWSLPGPVVDKHSTGGVGDLVSFIVGPILAACGTYVPMISGRGLAHTGGTIDKLESIPGYNTSPETGLFKQCVKQAGLAIVGQSEELAPADRRMYAIRHETSTVESTGLITASILAKKYAEGLDGLVIDVKYGNGAFMKDRKCAVKLAESLESVASHMDIKCQSVLTDMNSPLAYNVGNSLEIREAIEFLVGEHQHPCVKAVSLHLAAEALRITDVESNYQKAYLMALSALGSGRAAEKFENMIGLLGGPSDFLSSYHQHLPSAKIQRPVTAWESGYISSFETTQVGFLSNRLGYGSNGKHDLSTGLSDLLPLGSQVEKGQSLVVIHANTEEQWLAAKDHFVSRCVTLSKSRPEVSPRIADIQSQRELKYA